MAAPSLTKTFLLILLLTTLILQVEAKKKAKGGKRAKSGTRSMGEE